jgi:CheY-like chemotaxis protein
MRHDLDRLAARFGQQASLLRRPVFSPRGRTPHSDFRSTVRIGARLAGSRYTPATNAGATSRSPSPTGIEPLNDFDGVDILLVEDNAQDAEMTMRALKKAANHTRIYWVMDGVEALDFVRCRGAFAGRDRRQDVKLVLLDLKMPRLDGIDVLRDLKADPETKKIPIVIMTSSNSERDITATYELGVNGFVTKPVQVTEFSAVVGEIGIFWLTVNRAPTT